MDFIDNYFNSIKERFVIDADIYQEIKKKIESEKELQFPLLKNLTRILESNSEFKLIELNSWLNNFSLPLNIQVLPSKDKFKVSRVPVSKIEPNSLRIKTQSCGVIQFRVPPNTLKSAIKAGEDIAQYYVLTEKTFHNGINYINIAFPVFDNFFNRGFRKTYLLCVNEDIKRRAEILLKEEIFGPTIEEFIESGFTEEEAKEFYNELQLFVFKIKENGKFRNATLNDYVDIYVFNNNSIKVQDVEIIKRGDLDIFEVKEKGETLGFINLTDWEDVTINEEFSLKEPGKDVEFGVYFFDPSTGFDPERLTSSFIIWIGNGKGMVVDPLTNLPQYLDKKQINRNDIEYIFLTHIHSDHDDGVLEQILSGRKIKILTTKIVFNSFIRKVAAITGWSIERIKSLLSFQEIKKGEDFKLNEKCYIKVDYAFHTIPTCRFVITYFDNRKNIKKSIAYSGDTNFNREYINKLVEDNKLSKERAESILGFIWDSDLIIHDTGGGIHTDIKELSKLPEEIQKKIIAIHTHSIPPNSLIRQAKKGDEIILVEADLIDKYKRLMRILDEVILFKDLTYEEKLDIISNAKKERYQKGEIILKANTEFKNFYIIKSGEVEVITLDNRRTYLGKGDYFGEMAFFQPSKSRNANIYAKTDVELFAIDENNFEKYKSKIFKTYENIVKNRPLLAKISFFKMLSEREINALASLFIEENYRKGDFIIKYGEIGDKFYIVKNGLLKVIVKDNNGNIQKINQLGVGDPFGEIALIEKVKRTADVIVDSDYATVISIDSETFYNITNIYPGIALGIEEIKNIYKSELKR